VDREVDPAVRQCLVYFLGEQSLAADFCQRTILHGVTRGADDVLLEHVHAAQHGAEALQPLEEESGLHQGERRPAGAHPERQNAHVWPDPRRLYAGG
jgi:hypothetical protein